MILNYKKHLIIVLAPLTLIWGCDSLTQNESLIENEMLLSAEVVDERLVFDTKTQLDNDVQKLKNLSRESFEDVLSRTYRSGFTPAVPIVSDSDKETINMLESRMKVKNS